MESSIRLYIEKDLWSNLRNDNNNKGYKNKNPLPEAGDCRQMVSVIVQRDDKFYKTCFLISVQSLQESVLSLPEI